MWAVMEACTPGMMRKKVRRAGASPHVAGDHQTHNANAMADAGAAVRLADGELTTHLLPTVSRLLAEPTTLSAMATASSAMAKPDAAAVIAADILSLIDA